ncbi:hypothetical protein M011DRAFT_342276 [Sporormia fimetaria CBS 119925]|uniref:Uncharacterized protein n=1 Tax=Sporormia fimetaria CBS 119925 TaxID=1340428 RepID=A0A6A6VFA5_9PLEO|nr:hypothetical protein M011DRAFT_342276 [Sporormia fimetaria CBS 119925]
MLDNPCMLGNPAPGVTARILYLLLFFIPIAIQKSLLLLSPVRSYNAEPTLISDCTACSHRQLGRRDRSSAQRVPWTPYYISGRAICAKHNC